jgi:hypothetical protein
VDNPFLVRVLDGVADLNEELDALGDSKAMGVTIRRDRLPFDQLHDEVGAAAGRCAAVQDSCDAGMVHEGERLALRLEAREHGAGVHSRLDKLHRDGAADRRLLFGPPDGTHAA